MTVELVDRQSEFVLALLSEGLRIRESLERGEALSFDLEYANIREMLLAAADLDGGMKVSVPPNAIPQALWKPDTLAAGAWSGEFLGVRYPLVCWFDEVFCLDSPWADRWNEHKLEAELYGTNDRAWKFWQQAAIVDAKADSNLMQIFFWCVMLGFRGMLAEEPIKLVEWGAAQREKLCRIQPLEFPEELEPDPPTLVPPHNALLYHQRMLLICGITLMVVIPTLFFLLVRFFST
jgi:type VI secretion system protein ImpK